MTEAEAINLIKPKLAGYKFRKQKETANLFTFMCEALDPDVIPSKLVAAVNRKTGKSAVSMRSQEEAINAVM